MTKGSTNDSQSAARKTAKKVVFKQKATTMSGDEYDPEDILELRAVTRKRNKNAMVLHPKLAPTTPILDGEYYTDEWPSTDPANSQSDSERYNARKEKEGETPLTGKWTPDHAGYKGWFGRPLYGGVRKTKKRKQRKTRRKNVKKA